MISTNNTQAGPNSSNTDALAAIRRLQEVAGFARKLRYRTSVWAPMEPAVSKTSTYEMVIFHPAALDSFLARLQVTNAQLALVGLSPATEREWFEWAQEAAQKMRDIDRAVYGPLR